MTIRILTWNLWLTHGDWQARQPAIRAVLDSEKPDIVAIQETFDAFDGHESQVAALADHLGFNLVLGPGPDGFESPVRNAILSRWPIQQTHGELLASEGKHRYRSLVGAHIDTPDGVLPVFTTHLEHRFDRSALRQEQLGEAVRYIASVVDDDTMFPPVLTGDLNAVPNSDEIRRLTGRAEPYDRVFIDAWDVAGDGPGLTWTSTNPHVANKQWPNRRLDYIATAYSNGDQKLRVRSAELAGIEPVDGVMASDHYAVVANFTPSS